MIVVDSGDARAGTWQLHERDIVADYRAAFGEEPPPIVGIALMTDTDNTGESAIRYPNMAGAPRCRRATPDGETAARTARSARAAARDRPRETSPRRRRSDAPAGATPFFTAVISARIDTAISGGVRLPM